MQEEESPAIQAIMKGMEAMQVTVAALAAAQAGGGTVAAVETGKPKEETEVDRLRAENEKLRATQAEGSWEQRYRPKGKGGKGGKWKGPAQGCFTCGGPHYQNQCPQWQGKGYYGGRGGGYGGGYGKGSYGQGGGGYGSKGGCSSYGGGQPWQGGQQQQKPQAQGTPNQNNQNQAIVPVNSVEQQNGAQHGHDKPRLTPLSQVVGTVITGPSGASTTTGAGELARATTLLYPQYLWAQVMGRQMAQLQREVPLTGPEIQGMWSEKKEQGGQSGQGEGDPAPSPTPQCPALHHTGTGAAQCSQGEGREGVAPLMGLPGTSEGPARLTQQVGGARDPAVLHIGEYSGRSHQGLHWDSKREAWEQPRQRLSLRGVSQASWRQGDDSSTCER